MTTSTFTNLFEALPLKLGQKADGGNVGKFLEWWYDVSQENPLNSKQRIFKNCCFEISKSIEDKNFVTLNNIVTLEKGSGSIALKALLGTADELGVGVDLYALNYSGRGLTTEQLKDWYRRRGFFVTGRSENAWGESGYDMKRHPKT